MAKSTLFKNGIIYQRFWYIRKRKAKKLRFWITATLILALLFFCVSYFESRMLPYLMEISEFKARAIITSTVTSAISSGFAENIKYEELVTLRTDENGRITSIQTNVVKMNNTASRISGDIQQKLAAMERQSVAMPAGVLLGNSTFAGLGPDIHIQIVPVGSVETDIKSEFTSAGINQTRHRILLQIKTNISIVVPLMKKQTEVITSVPIAETVIVGDVPEFYLDSR